MTIDPKDLGSRAERIAEIEARCKKYGATHSTYAGAIYDIEYLIEEIRRPLSPAPVVPSNLEDKGRARSERGDAETEFLRTLTRTYCEAADIHLTCAYPNCNCQQTPRGIAAVALQLRRIGLYPGEQSEAGPSESARLKAIEDCAKVAENYRRQYLAGQRDTAFNQGFQRGTETACENVARAIRALSDPPPRSGDA